MSNIDLHNHVIPPTIIDAIMRDPHRFGTRFEEKNGKRYFNSHGRMAELQPAFYSVDAKVAWMDRVGLDIAAISVGADLFLRAFARHRACRRAAQQRRHRADGRAAARAAARHGHTSHAGS